MILLGIFTLLLLSFFRIPIVATKITSPPITRPPLTTFKSTSAAKKLICVDFNNLRYKRYGYDNTGPIKVMVSFPGIHIHTSHAWLSLLILSPFQLNIPFPAHRVIPKRHPVRTGSPRHQSAHCSGRHR